MKRPCGALRYDVIPPICPANLPRSANFDLLYHIHRAKAIWKGLAPPAEKKAPEIFSRAF
jgi:hypothetical protein